MPRIGPIVIDRPFCQAGLAGYSDRAMRVVARRRGCPYAVTEATADALLVNGGLGLGRMENRDPEDRPLAGQIMGSDPSAMARAARLLHERGHDVVDLNFACPVRRVAGVPRGGHLMADVTRAVAILRAVRAALPQATLTVSLRRGFDDTEASRERFEEIVEEIWALGYDALRIHARTVEQKYAGRSRWDILADARRRWPGRTILGSGDVFTAQDAVRMLRETGVDVVWIARGAIGNPWIFAQAATLLGGGEAQPPTVHEQRDALAEHLALGRESAGDAQAARRTRKIGIKASRFHPEAAAVRRAFIEADGAAAIEAVLDRHFAADGAGCWPAPDAADEVNGSAADSTSRAPRADAAPLPRPRPLRAAG